MWRGEFKKGWASKIDSERIALLIFAVIANVNPEKNNKLKFVVIFQHKRNQMDSDITNARFDL